MTTDKPQRMKLPKSARPGIEVDAHGDPIPVRRRTSENRAKAVASEIAERAAGQEVASEE